MKKVLLILALTGCLLGLAGCPDDRPDQPTAIAELYQLSLDHLDFFTRLKENEDRYLFTQARQFHASMTRGEHEAILPYGPRELPELAAEIRGNAIWLVAGADAVGVPYQLRCFKLPDDNGSTISLVNTTEIAAGVQYEYRISEPVMALTIRIINVRNTAWEISREIMLSGLDKSYHIHSAATNWIIDIDSDYLAVLPEILDVSVDGVANNYEAKQFVQYPQNLLAPMFIFSGKEDGLVGAVSDEHPLLLDRIYRLSIDYITAESGISRVKLEPRYWQETSSSYGNAKVNSGTTLRDQFVMAHSHGLAQSARGTGISFAELASFAAQVTHAFQFTPMKVNPRSYGSLVQVNEWVNEQKELGGFIQHVADNWDVSAVIDDIFIIDEIRSEETVNNEIDSDHITVAECEEYVAVYNQYKLLNIPAYMLPKCVDEGWVRVQKNGVSNLSTQSAESLAYGTEYAISLANAEYRRVMATSPVSATAGGDNSVALRNVASLYFQSELPEQRRQELAGRNLLRWCSPPSGELQLLELSAEAGCIGQQRLLVDLYAMTFGIMPVLSVPDGTLAELLLRLTPRTSGVEYHAGLVDYSGFAAATRSLSQLISISGDYGIALKSDTSSPEEGMVAYFPADMRPADAVVFMFIGMDGAVQVVNSNRIQINSGEQSWEQEIPYGMWAPEHPDPTSVGAGDAVIITRELISAPSGVGGSSSG